jgi:hypothetical protein
VAVGFNGLESNDRCSNPCASALPFWSDEAVTIVSCSFYVGGNVVFITGSIFFFPRILEAGGPVIRYSACMLFVLGSVLFIIGALIDVIVLVRTGLQQRKKAPRWCISARSESVDGVELALCGNGKPCGKLGAVANGCAAGPRPLRRVLSAPLQGSKASAACNRVMQALPRKPTKIVATRKGRAMPVSRGPASTRESAPGSGSIKGTAKRQPPHARYAMLDRPHNGNGELADGQSSPCPSTDAPVACNSPDAT